MTTLRYYFDFISPYAYLGWAPACALAQRRGLTLDARPVLFAAMLNHFGHKGPAEIKPKRVYTFKHVLRLAHDRAVPLRPPPAHPFNPLLALRVAEAAEPGASRHAVVDILFGRTWGTGEGVTDPDAIAAALESRGLPGSALVAAASTTEIKARVRASTEHALAVGVFGVPSMQVDDLDEIFWGQDALAHLERFIDGRDPITAAEVSYWRNLPVGSARKQPKAD